MAENMAPEQDVVVNSRVRLSRNWLDLPFVRTMSDTDAAECICRAMESLEAAGETRDYRVRRMADMGENERGSLLDHQLISHDLLKNVQRAAALISEDDSVTVMVNEEDHLRLQGLLEGLQLEQAAKKAFHADEIMGASAAYAFDMQLGYLTSSPTIVGTGLRATVTMHLFGLSRARQIPQIIKSVNRIGLSLRGLYGSGSDAMGGLYLLSNQATLGRSEDDIIKTVSSTALQIADRERSIRENMKRTGFIPLMDSIMRSAGICGNARLMSLREFMNRYADLRLGASLGALRIELSAIDNMMMDLQPSSLGMQAGRELRTLEGDMYRAEQLRKRISMQGARREPI
ncbi:MAG: ATP--guanido phosphotransferase [Christensenellales bacterium]|jgi:protein arginine kinase